VTGFVNLHKINQTKTLAAQADADAQKADADAIAAQSAAALAAANAALANSNAIAAGELASQICQTVTNSTANPACVFTPAQ
jgi:hypothetical protein